MKTQSKILLIVILILVILYYLSSHNEYLNLNNLLIFSTNFKPDNTLKCKWNDPSGNIINKDDDECKVCLYCTDSSGNSVSKTIAKDASGNLTVIPQGCTNKIWYYTNSSCNK